MAKRYFNGNGVKVDYAESVKWLTKAAQQDDAWAQMMLGHAYSGGIGVKTDMKTAKKWFGKACDNKLQDGCDMYRQLNQGTK